jgi:hypothetical protein
MDKVNFLHLKGKQRFFVLLLLSVITPASADEALSSSIDCSTVDINYIDDPQWTESERLAAMDKAFFDSLDRFELCNLSNHSNSTSTASENEASGSESEFGQESVASPLMTGTETESALADPNESELYESANDETELTPVGSGYGGKQPDDIPEADNDDVIASQIRLAAEIEQDPVKKEKLWNEYRKYKGLPVNDDE